MAGNAGSRRRTKRGVGKDKKDIMLRKLSRCLLTIGALVPAVNSLAQAQLLPPLTHHVRDVVRTGEAKPTGKLAPDRVMTLDVVLPLSDQAGLNSFLKELYAPTSPSYRQFLTVREFTERFGPSQADYDAVVQFVKANGFALSADGGSIAFKQGWCR